MIINTLLSAAVGASVFVLESVYRKSHTHSLMLATEELPEVLTAHEQILVALHGIHSQEQGMIGIEGRL